MCLQEEGGGEIDFSRKKFKTSKNWPLSCNSRGQKTENSRKPLPKFVRFCQFLEQFTSNADN